MERIESRLFKINKEKLKAEQKGCFICGSQEDLEVHHMVCPYAKREEVNFAELKAVCEAFDVYGYSRVLASQPITCVDDIRNLILLCEGHHKRADHGIHNVTFADWIMQKVRKGTHED